MASEPETESLEGLAFHSTSTYTLVEELGRGGMGIVFLAEKHAEGVTDEVVLKTIKTVDTRHEEQLRNEANIATRLRHENIVKSYGLESIPLRLLPSSFLREIDALSYAGSAARAGVRAPRRISVVRRGSARLRAARRLLHDRSESASSKDERKLLLLVQDYVEGTDMGDLVRDHLRKKLLLPVPLAAFVISRICRALDYAHQWIIHRDISPENVLLNTQGVCKLSDFGIAVGTHEAIRIFAGKLNYMSPEQMDNRPLDSRSDIYSLGIFAYQILTGILPLHAASGLPAQEQARQIREQRSAGFPSLAAVRPDIPETLSKIVERMTDPDIARRYPRVADAGNDLEQKVLYAEGFGPTNNSLQSYLQIYESDFRQASQDQLRQLRFLEADRGKIRLQRPARSSAYTAIGRRLIDERKGTLIHAAVTRQSVPTAEESRRTRTVFRIK